MIGVYGVRERRTPAPRKATAVFEAIDVPDSIPEVFLLKMRSIYITEPPNKGKVREKSNVPVYFSINNNNDN